MPLRFAVVCNLLSDLEVLYIRDPPLLPAALEARSERLVEDWFKAHRRLIDAHDANLTALLSTLLPAKRSDRVYRLQPARLCAVLGRCFRLGRSRQADLERWKVPDCGTLAECVERVQKQAPNQVSAVNSVTIEEVDATLAGIAARYAREDEHSRTYDDDSAAVVERLLGRLYSRLSPRDCKWLTRLILKDFAPISLNEYLVISRTHRLLPLILRVRATLPGAVVALRQLGLRDTQSFEPAGSRERCIASLRAMPPLLGTFAGRPNYYFGRSVKYLVHAAQGRQMCLERKYDGEYCQVHVDLRNRGNEIQLFSKSGKDSTKDRLGLHYAIRRSLRIGRSDSLFKETAILEGELLVWCDEKRAIQPFHKIRNHVQRAGRPLGAVKDDPPPPSEHLMIMFYDVLTVDGEPLIHQNYATRRRALLGLVDQVMGLAKVAPSQIIDFSASGSTNRLLQCLSEAFARKWEGYMMKPVNEPYVSMGEQPSRKYYASFFKIKKDYITGLGDTADLLIVGASYDAATAARLLIPKVPWTHLHLACRPVNRMASTARQKYRVLHVTNEGLDSDALLKLCRDLKFRAVAADSAEARELSLISWPYDIFHQMPAGRVIFREPVVVEMKGYGFEVPGNESYYALRFPKFVKIKWDVDPDEADTFQKLQDLAHEAISLPDEDSLLTEVAMYRKRLERYEMGSKLTTPWWEDTDSRSVSPDRKGIPVYEDEEDTLTYNAPPLHGEDTGAVFRPLENLPRSDQADLSLVRKISHGAEDYATRINRIAARKKRKQPETPSQQDTTSAELDTEPGSQVSVPLPNRKRKQAHVPAYGKTQLVTRDCDTPQHPVFDASSEIKGTCISPPNCAKESVIQSPCATTDKMFSSSAAIAPNSTPASSPSCTSTAIDFTICEVIVGIGVPEKYIEHLHNSHATLQCICESAKLKTTFKQGYTIFLDPKDPRSASWLHEAAVQHLVGYGKDTCISIWDWRVVHWLTRYTKGKSRIISNDMTRQRRQNYIGRVEMHDSRPHVVWADGTRDDPGDSTHGH